ncbi:MAG TPA: fibronectin type III domain-containing protein, partial [Chitinivibrionales bacterium]
DDPLVERHDVSLYETRTQLRNIIDSAVVDSFSLVVDPLAFDGSDTIIAVVRDKANHTDTLRQSIYYGMPPYIPQAVYPLNLMSVSGTSVTLSWQDVDPDGDNLFYDVYFGPAADQMTLRSTTTAVAALITGLLPQHTYFWKISAHDWKSFTDGPTWQFTTR